MGGARTWRQGRKIKRASVGGLDAVSVGQASGDRRRGRSNVEGRCVGRQEVARCTRVEDGPPFDRIGVGGDRLKDGCGCESIVVGGVRTIR